MQLQSPQNVVVVVLVLPTAHTV